jgi:hypothetical protein
MKLRTALTTVVTGFGLALASGAAMAVPCDTLNTIGEWQAAGSCDQNDKIWTFGASNLGAGVQVLFSVPAVDTHAMQIVGFDNSDLAGAWSIDYSISVSDPNWVINAMFAGADNPGGGSNLSKDITGDAIFSLSVVDGVEGPGSQQLGLSATNLNISENFSVLAGSTLLSVSNTFTQVPVQIPEPGTLALMGIALTGLAFLRRRRD